jgi:hypothetical protein
MDQTVNNGAVGLLTNVLKNVTINGGTLSLGNTLTLSNGFLSIGNGATLHLGNNDIILKSTTHGNTAQVGAISGSIAYGTGRFVVERCITGKRRGYRNLSCGGVLCDGSIFDNWQEGGASPTGYGMHITGVKGGAGIDAPTGLDRTRSGSRSLWTYSTSDTYVPVTNTKSPAANQLLPFVGYFALVRGDRSYDLFNSSPELSNATTVLRTRGKLLAGTVRLSSNANPVWEFSGSVSSTFRLNNNTTPPGKSTADYGFSLLGNPYACAINWNSIYARSNGASYSDGHLAPYYWTWNARANNGAGAWVVVDHVGVTNMVVGTGISAGGGTSHPSGDSTNTQYIQPGQSFFIQNDNTNNHLVVEIQEGDKSLDVAANPLKAVFSGQTPPATNRLRIHLFKQTGTDTVLADGALVDIGATHNNGIDVWDARKMANKEENIAVAKDGQLLAIESRAASTAADTVGLQLWQLVQDSTYWLQIATKELGKGQHCTLLDHYLHTQTALNEGTVTNVPFQPTADSSSYYHRFSVVVAAKPVVLPVRFLSVSPGPNYQQQPAVMWEFGGPGGIGTIAYFEVARSVDGVSFTPVGKVLPLGSRYGWTDTAGALEEGKLYYRIKAVYAGSGEGVYSRVVAVELKQIPSKGLLVYPNPVSTQGVRLGNLGGEPAGFYRLGVYDVWDKEVFKEAFYWPKQGTSYGLQLRSKLAAGWYRAVLRSADGSRQLGCDLLVK